MSSQYGAMLREGLAAEFPSAKRAVDRLVVALRSPQVGREAPLWAAISAFGADWAVGAIGQVLAMGLRVAGLHDPAIWLSGGFAILGYALAVAVALRAGGRRGLIWYLVILAVGIGVQIAISVPGFATFCERSGECSLLRFVVPYLYVAAGLAVGALASRMLRTGPAHPNAFLSGAGAFLLLAALANVAFFFGVPQDPVALSAMAFVLNGAAAFGAGVVLRARSARPAPLVLLAGAIAVGWFASSAPFIVYLLRDGGSQLAATYLTGYVEAVALGAGWLTTALVQRARMTAAA